MLGAGLQFNRSRNGEDRFYSAARARLSQDYLRRAQSDVTPSRSRSRTDEALPEKSKAEVPASLPVSEPSPLCNLERDSSSDGSSDSEQERGGLNYSREQSVRDQHMTFQEGFSSDEGEPGSSQSCLFFEYLERDQPYSREPLANKISDLALHFPELKTLRSCDLLPSSWISVAWYPIYRIPTGPTLRDMDACFLTFHSLHTPMTGSEVVHPPVVTYPTESDGVPQISLPVFGLASYKYKVSLWTPNTGHQRQLSNALLQAADNWLNLLQVGRLGRPDSVGKVDDD
ncbi:hypothetical protein ACS0TY_008367 [Phlomoides rotata]